MAMHTQIDRSEHRQQIEWLLQRFAVVGIVGARQVGKTTLARQIASNWPESTFVLDLEDAEDRAKLVEPKLTLGGFEGLVVIDEIQLMPELFPLLRVLADRPGNPARFLVLGSASPHLLQQGSETLAGRIAYHRLDGFNLAEVGSDQLERLWSRGGFPRSFLAADDEESYRWRREFIRTFIARDVPQIVSGLPSETLRRFWTMLAHSHGQIWNASRFARNFGVADTTMRRYLDLLVGMMVVRQLPPYHANLSKRQVKSPKVYLADTGILHALLGLRDRHGLLGHPVVGHSWESFIMQEILRTLDVEDDGAYFWATHAGAELDLLVLRGSERIGFEIKRTVAPKITKSMRIAMDDLDLDRLDVVHAGEMSFPLDDRIRAVASSRLAAISDHQRVR